VRLPDSASRIPYSQNPASRPYDDEYASVTHLSLRDHIQPCHGITVKLKPMLAVRFVTPIEQMQGNDPEETEMLRSMATEATRFISSFAWCGSIEEAYFGSGVGKIIAIFFFLIRPSPPGSTDRALWVIVGDMRAIANGVDAVSVRNEITDRERELQGINAQIVSAKPDSVRTKIQDARKYVEATMKDIKKLFGVDAAAAKVTLAKHMPQIVLKPATKDGRKIYQVISQWELLEGTSELPAFESKRMVGAEGQS
jgi:hypothetical protein